MSTQFMDILEWSIFLFVWWSFGFAGCGLYFASAVRSRAKDDTDFEIKEDKIISALILVFGLAGLFAAMTQEIHGWLWPWGKAADKELNS